MQVNIDKLSAHEHLILASLFQSVCGRRPDRRRASHARILRRRLQCGGSFDGVAKRVTNKHCRGQCFHYQLEFDECDVVYGFGWLGWHARPERQPLHWSFDGDRKLHADLHRCGWQ